MDNRQQASIIDTEQNRNIDSYPNFDPSHATNVTASQPPPVRMVYNTPLPGFTPPASVGQVPQRPASQPAISVAQANSSGSESDSLPIWPFAIAAIAGTILALVIVPAWVPALGGSLVGAEPK